MLTLYRWFWYLLPANPILVRVVQGGSRRVRHLWVRMGYLGALVLLVLIGLLSGQGIGEAVSLNELAKAGTWVFALVSYGQVALICLLAPLFMAGAISSERSGETFDILLTTPLSNLQIVLGSLLSRLFFVLALLASGLPLFSVLLIFGGVPIESVFVAFAAAGMSAVLVGSVAVTLSTLRSGGRKAVFVFVISIAAYLIFIWLVDVLLLRQFGPAQTTTWLTPLHPLLVLEASFNSANYRPPGAEMLAAYPALPRFYLGQPFAAFTALTGSTSLLLVLWCSLWLRRVGQEPRLMWLRRKLRMSMGGERRRAPRRVWANPIAWREASTRGSMAVAILARWSFAFVGLVAAVALLGGYHFQSLPTLAGPGGMAMTQAAVFRTGLLILLMLELAVIVMVALYMSAGSVSREREDGTLDLMLTTPITPKQYIWGKLRGLVSFLTLLIAVPVATIAMASAYTGLGLALDWPTATTSYIASGNSMTGELVLLEAPVLLVLMLVPFVALCAMVGMSWSLKARGVLGAVAPSVAIIGGLAMVLGFCGFAAASGIPVIGPMINAFSPVTNLYMIINPWDHIAGFDESPMFGRVTLLIAAAVAAAGYSLIVYMILLSIVRGFDHTVRKLSGTG